MRNYSQEARQRTDPLYDAEVEGVSVALHQGDGVENLARLLQSREYGTCTGGKTFLSLEK